MAWSSAALGTIFHTHSKFYYIPRWTSNTYKKYWLCIEKMQWEIRKILPPTPPLVGGFFNLKAWLPLGCSILLGTPMSKYYLQFHPLTNIEDPGGYSWEFVVRVPRPVLQILTLFQIKKNLSFSMPFWDLVSKIYNRLQTRRRQELCYHYLD